MTDNVANETISEETVQAVEPAVVEAVKKVNARRVKTERKPRGRKAASISSKPRAEKPAPEQKDNAVNFDPANWMNLQSFAALPGADRFQNLFAEAGSKGQEAIEKSRKAAEEFAELTRANVEAVVEAGKIAATGAKSVGEDALQRTREGLEQNVAEFKSLAQAQSPSEFFQLQSEIAKQNFDRVVASFSQLTEATVKLAGEAIQPLSSRAAVNAEKINELTA
ncbi:phasin family protein [Sphingomonas sp. LHG3406-1]|uniref:phasin family protein n=1 Tax=Sphingomonas sp. LHG3406-1 TaxID=2804617 RepID=UPI002624929A|nr:phasin family protein [Sphingomonas sp. LHG3406-1]